MFKDAANELDRRTCGRKPFRISSLIVVCRPVYKLPHVVVQHMQRPLLKTQDDSIGAHSATQQKKDTMLQTPLSERRSRLLAHAHVLCEARVTTKWKSTKNRNLMFLIVIPKLQQISCQTHHVLEVTLNKCDTRTGNVGTWRRDYTLSCLSLSLYNHVVLEFPFS